MPAKRPTVRRRLPPKYAKEIRAYATRIGLVNWAWASLCSNLFVLFWFLLTRPGEVNTRNRAHGIWHTIQSDKTQRDMLSVLAKTEMQDKPKLLEKVLWVIDRAGKLSEFRNIATHVEATFSEQTVSRPAADPISSRTSHENKFNLIEHDRFWKLLAGDMIALSDYAACLVQQLYYAPNLRPDALPHRPVLRAIPEIQRIESQISRLSQPAKPKRPRRSSHAKRESQTQKGA